jgi:hypothetical protein
MSVRPNALRWSRRASLEDREAQESCDPPDGDRVELAAEALLGAKWLLLLACQALDGSRTLQRELQETKREHDAIASLCETLGARGVPTLAQ